MDNIFLSGNKEQPYQLQLIDFGSTERLTPSNSRSDWKEFCSIMASLERKNTDSNILYFKDLLLAHGKWFLFSKNHHSEEELLNHPYFA